MRIWMLIFSVIIPAFLGAYLVDRNNASMDERVLSSNIIDMRDKTRTSIDGLIADGSLSSETYEATPSSEHYAELPNHQSDNTSDTSTPEILFQLVINACGSQVGNANLRINDTVIGIISNGTIVDLTGNVSGEWVEVSGLYWPTGNEQTKTGTGWLHQCWVSPDSMIALDSEPEPDTEPLGLLGRRGRSLRPSRPRRSYLQSTGELAGYVGRDLYDYALLYPRIAAYQSFWNFATDSGSGGLSPSYASNFGSTGSYSTFRPQQINSQLVEIEPGVYQGIKASEQLQFQLTQHQLQQINPQTIDRLAIVPGEPLMPWQQTLLKGHL